jgi:hypothetical protein
VEENPPGFFRSKLFSGVTCSSSNPIQHEKGADEKREYAVQSVAYRVRMPVDRAKDSKAEENRKQANDSAGNRGWDVEPTEAFEP